MTAVRIVSVGKHLPPGVVANRHVVKILKRHGVTHTSSGQRITAKGIENLLGVRERRRALLDQNTSDLALLAANDALAKARLRLDQISIVALGSSTPESFFPSTACRLLHKGNGPQIEASDLLGACTSGLYALVQVERALRCEPDYRYGLAIGAEVIGSRLTTFTDINDDLWGDGAGAVILEKSDNTDSGIICSILGSEPSLAPLTDSIGKGTRLKDFMARPGIYMAGHDIQKFVLKIIPWLIKETLAKANRVRAEPITLDDIALFAVHQANGRIFESPAKKLGIPLEKFYTNVGSYGNTSSASVLIVLCEAIEKQLVGHGDLVMMIAFGGGITYGSVLLRL